MAASYPTSMQSVYLDLLSRHLDRRVNELGGTPFLREIKGKGYWYTQIAIKGRKIQRYLGPDSDEMRKRIDRAQSAVEDQKSARSIDRSLVRQLESMGAPRLDRNTGSLLRAMSAVGVFRLGGTLVGTHAYRLYALELGVQLPGLFEATRDVDIASFEQLSLAIEDKVDPSLVESLSSLNMQPAPSLDRARPTKWITKGGGPDVEFLAPSFTEEENLIRLEALGGWAHGFHYLNYLIADPIDAVALYLDGILVQIPRPERYAIHKLIVAQRRKRAERAKARKDLDQARDLIEVLAADRPDDLEDAFETAVGTGPKWRQLISKSFEQRPEIKSLLKFA